MGSRKVLSLAGIKRFQLETLVKGCYKPRWMETTLRHQFKPECVLSLFSLQSICFETRLCFRILLAKLAPFHFSSRSFWTRFGIWKTSPSSEDGEAAEAILDQSWPALQEPLASTGEGPSLISAWWAWLNLKSSRHCFMFVVLILWFICFLWRVDLPKGQTAAQKLPKA